MYLYRFFLFALVFLLSKNFSFLSAQAKSPLPTNLFFQENISVAQKNSKEYNRLVREYARKEKRLYSRYKKIIAAKKAIEKAKEISNQDALEQNKLQLSGKTKLPPKLVDDKREGYYWTGIAGIMYNPDIGLAFAGVANYFRNGYRSEPIFSYTPYRENVMFTFGSSLRGVQNYWINYNAPYLRNKPIHFRFHAGVFHNIVSNYFGLNEDAQQPLTHPDGKQFRKFADYNNALRAIDTDGKTWSYYNYYTETKPELHLATEYEILSGKIRLLTALTFSYFRIQDYSDEKVPAAENKKGVMQKTLLRQDYEQQKILGFNGGFDNYFTLGFIYDTRDFEPDPSRGMYHEITYSQSAKFLGSAFNYYDVGLVLRGYVPLFTRYVKMVLAMRLSYHLKGMDVPFYVMKRLVYAQENVSGLGGLKTLRGFPEARFAGNNMLLSNFELRYTFARVSVNGHLLQFKFVPFIEFGRSYSTPQKTTLTDLNVAGGIGFKVSWNLSSLIALDVGFSKEDIAAYFGYGNIF